MDALIPAGKISRQFGKDGEVTIVLYGAFPDQVDYKEPVFVVIDNLPVPLFFERFERRGRSGALARFDDIDDPEKAEQLLGLEIFIRGGWADDGEDTAFGNIIGYRAQVWQEDEDGGITDEPQFEGEVTDFYDSDLNPLFEVTCEGSTLLIPAAGEFVDWMDEDSREIGFVIPEGLADLN